MTRICSPQLGLSPSSNLGGEVHDRETLNSLAEEGVEIEIILPKRKPVVKNKNFKITRLFTPVVYPPAAFNLLVIPYLFWIYKKRPFEILRVHSPEFIGWGAVIFKRFFPNVKLVATYHHLDGNYFEILTAKHIAPHFDLIITDSPTTVPILRSMITDTDIPIVPVTNAVSKTYQSLIKPKRKTVSKKLLYIGQLIERKNLPFIIKLLQNIPSDITLTIAGRGPEEGNLKQLVGKLNLTNRVEFLGYISEKQKLALYKGCDLFLYPSKLEGFGLAVAEASASGAVVIVAPYAGAKDVVINNKTGFILPLDENKWINTIKKLLKSPKEVNTLSINARKHMSSNFSWQMTAKKYLQAIKEIKPKALNLLFLCEYFYPYVHGGAETSIYLLAKALVKKGNKVTVLTPNYGTKNEETIEGIKIVRFPFKKLNSNSAQLTALWYANPLYVLYNFIHIARLVLKEKVDIIHSHSLYSLPAAALSKLYLAKPTVATFRDNHLLCSYGYCLTRSQFSEPCSLKEYLTYEFPIYYDQQVKDHNFINYTLQLALAVNARVRTEFLKFCTRVIDEKVCSSKTQSKTFAAQGWKTESIYNLYEFKPLKSQRRANLILYATKLSPGKGLDILLEAFAKSSDLLSKYTLLLVGEGNKQKYRQMVKTLGINKKVKFSGRLKSEQVNKLRQKVAFEVVPSLYPESFGRTALEALANGAPVLSSDRGGLREIVANKDTGLVVTPSVSELVLGMKVMTKSINIFHRRVKQSQHELKQRFELQPVEDYLKLYRKLV